MTPFLSSSGRLEKMDLSTDELVRIYRKELASAHLVELPDEFHSEAIKLIARLRSEIKRSEGLKRDLLEEEFKEAIFFLDRLYRVRVIKAMQEIAQGKIPSGTFERERTSFLEIKQLLENLRREYLAGVTVAEVPVLIPAETTRTLVTFLTDLHEKIPGVDSKVYGPFRAGDIANLPAPNAEVMIKHGLARKIESVI